VSRRAVRPAPAHRFVGCSRCAGGLLIEERMVDGQWERFAVRCQCLKQWLAARKTPAAPPPERHRADLQ
jgi:hypothetical protein